MSEQPLIETARRKITGMSTELFDVLPVGTEVTMTVKGRISKFEEEEQAREGTRRVQSIKLLRLVDGISEAVYDEPDGQMSMADVPEEPDDTDEGESDDEESNVVEFEGPKFSSGND